MSYRQKPVMKSVSANSVADKAGIRAGDEIVGANGAPVAYWNDFRKIVQDSRGEELSVSLKRNGREQETTLTVPEEALIGVEVEVEDLRVTDEYNFFEAIPAGFTRSIQALTDQVKQFKVIFNSKTGAYKQVKGPIGIVEMMPPTWDWSFFWGFLAMFSVWLAFLNILPIPALDGGHVMFLLYEMISGQKPSEKALETGQVIGFVILMGLMVLIFGNDIWNIIKRFI
jgi:regulator of sigma E protease